MTTGNVLQCMFFLFTSDTENTPELMRFKTIFQVGQSYHIMSPCPWKLALIFQKLISFLCFSMSLLCNLNAKNLKANDI